jgi:hypothetical protein
VAHLLRRSYREGGRVRKETVANLSHLPDEVIELIRRALRGERFLAAEEEFEVERSLPAGHVDAVLRMARKLGMARLLDREPSAERQLALALICQRVLAPASKLARSRLLEQSTLGSRLGVEGADEDALYAAMDWLCARQERIEARLARRHMKDGTVVLYDVSSSYFEGRCCPLAQLGYSRDQKRGTLQIIYGLLCAPDGCPVTVEVFEGSLHDDKTLPAQIEKLRERFGLSRVIVVSDRGIVTNANLELLARTEGASWITALKAPQVQKLAKAGTLQLSLFDQHNLAEITSDDYPGERLIVCRNPLIAGERAHKRESLLQATERALSEIKARVDAGTLHGAAQIGLAAGAVWNRWKVKKHFHIQITDTSLSFERKHQQIASEAALDGIYVLRTSVSAEAFASPRWSAPTSSSKKSSARSAPSKARSSCARSITASRTASKPTCSSACSPATWPGTCAEHSSRCSSTTSTPPPTQTPSPKPPAPTAPNAKPPPSAPSPASPATPSRPCSQSSLPRPATRSAWPAPTPASTGSADPPPPRRKPSS